MRNVSPRSQPRILPRRPKVNTSDRQRVLDRECQPYRDLLARLDDRPAGEVPTLHCSHCNAPMVRKAGSVTHKWPPTRSDLCPTCMSVRPAPRVPAKALAVEDLPRPTA